MSTMYDEIQRELWARNHKDSSDSKSHTYECYMRKSKVVEEFHKAFSNDNLMSHTLIRMCDEVISKIPTVFIEDGSKVYGEWVENGRSIGVATAYECSKCKYEVREEKRTKYCPNCGLRMLGVK